MTVNVEDVNQILLLLDPDIKALTRYFPLTQRDEIQQEIRINLWRKMTSEFAEVEHTLDDLEAFARKLLFYACILASKHIRKNKLNYSKRHVALDAIPATADSSYYFPTDPLKMVDFATDLPKYEQVLKPKEFALFKYLVETGHDFNNFDGIARQFGYTGKGSAKYILTKIAEKLIKFHESGQYPQ